MSRKIIILGVLHLSRLMVLGWNEENSILLADPHSNLPFQTGLYKWQHLSAERLEGNPMMMQRRLRALLIARLLLLICRCIYNWSDDDWRRDFNFLKDLDFNLSGRTHCPTGHRPVRLFLSPYRRFVYLHIYSVLLHDISWQRLEICCTALQGVI